MKRDRMGKFAKSQFRKIVEFEALLLGSVAVLGALVYFWTPIAITKAGEAIAEKYTQGF